MFSFCPILCQTKIPLNNKTCFFSVDLFTCAALLISSPICFQLISLNIYCLLCTYNKITNRKFYSTEYVCIFLASLFESWQGAGAVRSKIDCSLYRERAVYWERQGINPIKDRCCQNHFFKILNTF